MFLAVLERRRARGVTLLELIVFIVVVSVAVMGVLTALDLSNRSSTDPMIQKQALAIAEALLEEVQLQPFTYCDPDDTAAADANSAADCTGGAGGANDESRLVPGPPPELAGPEAGETRTSGTTPFDNVDDYHKFCMGPNCTPASSVTDINGTAINGLGAYTAKVTVAQQALGTIPTDASLLITVIVTGPASTTVQLDGYRVRYAPNTLP
jgi:MSHA pilin protein MshD